MGMVVKKRKGFTLTELMVVVVLVGITATFAIPNYTKSVAKAHEKDMITQLQTIHAANLIYRAQTGSYWSTGGTAETDLATINSTLGINLISNSGTTYSYNSADGSSFIATATWGSGSTMFSVQVTDAPLSSSNPSCASISCPTL